MSAEYASDGHQPERTSAIAGNPVQTVSGRLPPITFQQPVTGHPQVLRRLPNTLEQLIAGASDQLTFTFVNPVSWRVVQWVPDERPIQGCPEGIECLTRLDHVAIGQIMDPNEAKTTEEIENFYNMSTKDGKRCFFAQENSDWYCRQCCGPSREFKMELMSRTNEVALTVERPFKCCASKNWCAKWQCAQDEVTVKAKDESILGYVRQAASFIKPHYFILNAKEEPQFEIWGPACTMTMCCQPSICFAVKKIDSDKVVSRIRKLRAGSFQEMFTDADNFEIDFPIDMDVKMKATLLGCVFLIDFMYFESSAKGPGQKKQVQANGTHGNVSGSISAQLPI